MGSIDDLIRPNIRDLSPYSSAREQFMDYELTLLDANENAAGPLGFKKNPWFLHRYPDPYQREIKARLSALRGHPQQGIVLGNGSDEIIDLIIRICCEPARDQIMVTSPTYGMYKVCAHINNVGVTEVSLASDFQLDAGSLLRNVNENTKIIFLCSPNNPSGNLLAIGAILEILDRFPGLVVLDEAYIDFTEGSSLISKCQNFPRLTVMQTFSKAWGLAGIRLGVAYTSNELAHYLNKAKPPYNVNQLTQQHALQALDAADQLAPAVAHILRQRQELRAQLNKLPMVIKVYHSDANFLLVKMRDADRVFQYLIDRQIIVRNRSNVHLCEGCLRITVGSQLENEQLAGALKEYEL